MSIINCYTGFGVHTPFSSAGTIKYSSEYFSNRTIILFFPLLAQICTQLKL